MLGSMECLKFSNYNKTKQASEAVGLFLGPF